MSGCLVLSLSGCGNTAYELPYDANSAVSGFNVIADGKSDVADSFAQNLCITNKDLVDAAFANTEDAGSAILFDLNNSEVLYSQNAHERLSPASLTKVLTALVALKHATPDTVLTATDAVYVDESGAQLCGIKPGDTMTLNQALYIALVYSANDAALLIADNIGGSVDGFVEMMNEEAKALGATNSNFVNPHGLTHENQYTTAYDLYLIFNEALKYEKFTEIIQTSSYETTYQNGSGEAVQLSVRNTNKYVNGDVKAPENVTVIGGKTGTTNAAGHCLMVLSKDNNGAPYVSIILKAGSRDNLYAQMTDLLEEIGK
ncbi:MAG: D-alanyl-D-alanine carboxypeptidase [Lachnospiraceae bacterium]|nr:D-alanyl-D-alanine carboxypeptidase [Lachnospiraceae bacterium]